VLGDRVPFVWLVTNLRVRTLCERVDWVGVSDSDGYELQVRNTVLLVIAKI